MSVNPATAVCRKDDTLCQKAAASVFPPKIGENPALKKPTAEATPAATLSPHNGEAAKVSMELEPERVDKARNLFFRSQVRAILFSGIILLITLTWNSTFEKLFERFIGERDRFIAQLAYALLLTGILFMILYFITRPSFTVNNVSPKEMDAMIPPQVMGNWVTLD